MACNRQVVATATTCDKTKADANRAAGICPMAKCVDDSKYPSTCERVPRYHMITCPPAGSSTVSSNDPSCCCAKLCHMEHPDSTECSPVGSCGDFECCANNGNPIMESYPEQCSDPISGRTFTKCYGTGCSTKDSQKELVSGTGECFDDTDCPGRNNPCLYQLNENCTMPTSDNNDVTGCVHKECLIKANNSGIKSTTIISIFISVVGACTCCAFSF